VNDAQRALLAVFRELLEGPPPGNAFILNSGDDGLLGSLARLSAADASVRPAGRSSVAAHVHHVHYGLDLLNRWLRGEDPYADARFAESWRHQDVDADGWRDLRDALAREARDWSRAIGERTVWKEETWVNVIAITAHVAYHLGSIRQLTAAAAGPPATD
jgi:hypothetical protein